MTKREIAILICRVIALLALLRAFDYAGDLISFFYQIVTFYSNFDSLYARVTYGDGAPFVNAILFLNFSLFLFFLAEPISYWLIQDRGEKANEPVATLSISDWLTLFLIALGLVFFVTSVSSIASNSRTLMHESILLDKNHLLAVLGMLFQMACGLLLVYRSRRISTYLLCLNREDVRSTENTNDTDLHQENYSLGGLS